MFTSPQIRYHVGCRTDSALRERFLNVLDPSMSLNSWTSDEIKRLEDALEDGKLLGSWSKVAKEVKTRTDNQCWRQWKLLHPDVKTNFKANLIYSRWSMTTSRFRIRKGESPLTRRKTESVEQWN